MKCTVGVRKRDKHLAYNSSYLFLINLLYLIDICFTVTIWNRARIYPMKNEMPN